MKKIYKYRCLPLVLICFVVILTKTVCAMEDRPSTYSTDEIMLEYSTLGYHYDLIAELVDSNIPFYIDIEGIIRVDNKYKKEIALITQSLETRPHTILKDKKHASLLVLLFEENNINYIVRRAINNRDIHVIWEDKYDKEAQKIINGEFVQSIKDSYTTGILGKFNINRRE